MSTVNKDTNSECKYHCTNGKIFDPTIRQWIQCPECKDKREESIEKDDKEIEQIIGMKSNGLSTLLVPESIIPKDEQAYIKKDSIKSLYEELEKYYNRIQNGKIPSYSLCIGLGVKGKIDRVIYPLLSTGYSEGLEVSPVVSAIGLNQKIMNQEGLEPYIYSDLCVVLINEGCSGADMSACKGLMQERAVRGVPTVFVTSWSIEACSRLLGTFSDESLYLAKPAFIFYESSGQKSKYINNLLGVDNKIPTLEFDEFR